MPSRRDYRAEYRRRSELARERGFSSYWRQRQAPRALARASDFGQLPDAAREARTDALRVVARARTGRMTVEEAARELGIPMSTVRHWAAEALEPKRRGRTFPTRGDRLTRLRPILLEGETELTFIVVRGSRAADRANALFDIQWRYITGHADELELDSIRSSRIAGKTVEADPDRLLYLARTGAVDVPEAYREIIG